MQAIILAGGKGTRLRPYTTVLPKPLMPVGEQPILEVVVKQLKKYGFKEIVISTGHLAELIEAFFGNGKKFGVKIRYVLETKPLSTAGALKLVKNLSENFLVMNGDILCDVNYKEILKTHIQKKAAATICIKPQSTYIDYGIIKIDKDYNLSEYIEKPKYNIFVSTGIYAMNKKCIRYIKNNEVISMPDLLKRLKQNGEKVLCKVHRGFWLDIGRQDDYQKANDLVMDKKFRI